MADASSADRDPIERLAEEFLQRRRNGEAPALSEYAERYPDLADEIRAVFPALLLMERADPGTSDLARGNGDSAQPNGMPEQLGDFRILREVGRGGMGVVYEAEQVSLGRRVALKVLPPQALADPRYLGRFEREAKAAARLHHTNIVPVYGVGTDRAIHYYAMQFIQGQALNEVLHELRRLRDDKIVTPLLQAVRADAAPVSVAEVARSLLTGPAPPTVDHVAAADVDRAAGSTGGTSGTLPGASGSASARRAYWHSVARVGLQAAEAVAYAHGEGILHRDIKPSNLLLDARGHVWVADFGLAKTAEGGDLTMTGDIVGTIRYMAPERFAGQTDVRSDVYALGMTLYELAALTPAFADSDRHRLIHQITTAEPVHLQQAAPTMPRDLRTIVHKAIDKDPARRYATAAALADDLQRFLEDRPIQARPPSRVELLGRWCRRNPVVVGLLAAVVLVAVLGFAGVVAQWRDAVASGVLAQQNEERANQRGDELEQANQQLANSEANAKQQRDEIQHANANLLTSQERLRRALYLADLRLIPEALDKENLDGVDHFLDRQVPAAGAKDLRNFEWHYWKRQRHAERMVELEGDRPGKSAGYVGRNPVFSRDGTLFAGSDERDGQLGIMVWDTRTGAVRALCQGPFRAMQISLTGDPLFSPDGKRLAANFTTAAAGDAKAGNQIWVWDLVTGRALWHRVDDFRRGTQLVFHPDGSRLAAAAADLEGKRAAVKVWDTDTGKPVLELPAFELSVPISRTSDAMVGIAYSADGKRLIAPARAHDAAGAAIGRLLVWDAQTGAALPSMAGPTEHALPISLSFSQDGSRLAVVWQGPAPGTSGLPVTSTVWLHDPVTLKPLIWFAIPEDGTHITRVSLSADGSAMLTFSSSIRWNGEFAIRVWDTASQTLIRRLPRPLGTSAVAFEPAGRVLTAVHSKLETWDIPRPRLLPYGQPGEQMAVGPLLSDDGRRIAGLLRDVVQPEPVAVRAARLTSYLIMPGGPGPFLATANLLTSRRQPEVRRVEFVVLDVGSGKRLFTRAPARRPNNRVALTLTGDGKRLLIWQKDPTTTGTVVVWDVDTGKSVTTLTGDVILGVSHDGRRAATFLASGMLKIWDVPTGRVLCERKVEPAWPSLGPAPASLTFSPDGNRFAYALTKIHVVDVASGKDLWTRPVHQIRNAFFFQVATLVFSPDGRRLAVDSIPALNAPRELLIVDAATGVKQVRLEEGDRFAGAVVFSPDGSRIATAGREHVKLWDAVSGEELLTFLTLTKTPAVDHWQFRFSDDGRQLIGLRVAGYPPTATSAVRFTWDAAPLPPVAAAPPRQRDAAPTTAFGHHALGLALLDKRQRSEAVGAFRKAIALDPRFAPAYLQLGRALSAGRDYDEAVAAYRRLLERMPEHATANHDLGWTLMRLGRFDEAIAAYRRTIELDPTHRRAVANLRDAYIGQGNFAEAYKTAQRALQLFNKQEADWASVYVRAELCRRLVALAPRWPALVAGTQAPADNRERLDVARACQYQQRHVLASRLFTEAFAAEPAVADQLPTWDRYNAACGAALAGAGRGVDAGPLDDAGRARLRADALAWLRADLDQWRKRFQAEGALPAIRSALEHWQRDRDLADVRDTDALARLPAGELEAWRALWADVAALLK